MPYGKQYDQDRAAARWRAKSTLSDSDFNDWESGVAKGADVDVMPRATLPGAKQHEDDDYLTALGRDTGFETSKYKGSPVYRDEGGIGKPKRLGERGPGIYLPEDGAFSGGDMNTMDVDPVAKFDTPQERLQQKFAGRLGKMSADEKEMAYRQGRKMDIPAGLQARLKIKGIQDRIDAFGDALSPTQPQMRLPGAKPTGDTFAGGGGMGSIASTLASLHAEPDADQRGGVSDMDADNRTPLERAGGESVAFNGRGPLLPSSRSIPKPSLLVGPLAPKPAPDSFSQPMDFRQKLMQAALAKELGVEIPDERKLADAEEERRHKREQYEFEKQKRDVELEQIREAARLARMTPEQRAAEKKRVDAIINPNAEADRLAAKDAAWGDTYFAALKETKDPQQAAEFATLRNGGHRPKDFKPFNFVTQEDKNKKMLLDAQRLKTLEDEVIPEIQRRIEGGEDESVARMQVLAQANNKLKGANISPIDPYELKGRLKAPDSSLERALPRYSKAGVNFEDAKNKSLEFVRGKRGLLEKAGEYAGYLPNPATALVGPKMLGFNLPSVRNDADLLRDGSEEAIQNLRQMFPALSRYDAAAAIQQMLREQSGNPEETLVFNRR